MGKMIKPILSVNDNAKEIVDLLIKDKDRLKLSILNKGGATIIDAGINVEGSYRAGALITDICMGGLGKTSITTRRYGDFDLPTVTVTTNHPAVALLGSQLAGWRIKSEEFFALGSGPARALSMQPKELYEEIKYQDRSKYAILLMETDQIPEKTVLELIAQKCGVDVEKVYLIVAPTSSIVGSTQISGRIAETGLHKLHAIGVDPLLVLSAAGSAPIAPQHPDNLQAMGRTNDVIFFAGSTYYTIKFNDDTKLEEVVRKTPSMSSKDYGKPFYEVFKEANFDFFRIDPGLFAPAEITMTNLTTGKTFKAGSMNLETLQKSIGYSSIS